jgi:hypothetical protein
MIFAAVDSVGLTTEFHTLIVADSGAHFIHGLTPVVLRGKGIKIAVLSLQK